MTDPGQPPLSKWLQKYRRAIYVLLLVAAFVAVARGIFIALPIASAAFTAEALLAKRILARRRIITRAEDPFFYWVYISVWTWATLYALVLLFQKG